MSLLCLKYVHENMGCSWHEWGIEWKHAFLRAQHDVLEYIHLNGGKWCKEEELLKLDFVNSKRLIGKRAQCLLYMHCCGGCKLPSLRGTKVGERVLALMQERRAAVLLSFWTAGRVRAGNCAVDAAHAAMDVMPAELIRQIICIAKVVIAD
ncbi:hypothetical protein COCOBI_10-0620 [Coccomyxa sp. Obi]|nr:hypothetical protein COCOBI_10-0620 [Coccomyxa sp. Obi]